MAGEETYFSPGIKGAWGNRALQSITSVRSQGFLMLQHVVLSFMFRQGDIHCGQKMRSLPGQPCLRTKALHIVILQSKAEERSQPWYLEKGEGRRGPWHHVSGWIFPSFYSYTGQGSAPPYSPGKGDRRSLPSS